MNILKIKNAQPVNLTCGFVLLLLCYFIFYKQGYTTGYGHERVTLSEDIVGGYKAQGGDWSFGRIILPAVLVLAWFTRGRYKDLKVNPSYVLGGLVLLFGFSLYFTGYKANQKYFGFASGQIIVMGMVLWFLGRECITLHTDKNRCEVLM